MTNAGKPIKIKDIAKGDETISPFALDAEGVFYKTAGFLTAALGGDTKGTGL